MTCEMEDEQEQDGYGYGADPVVLRLPSSSEYVLLARLVVSCAGRLAGFEPEDIYDLKLAVTEAVTNVIRHAEIESFTVEYRVLPGAVEITVVDEGRGFDAEGLSGKPGESGGFGLAVIRSLVDDMDLDSSTAGTRLKMTRRAISPEPS